MKKQKLYITLKKVTPRLNYLWYYKSYATWRDNQRKKEYWSSNLLVTCHKDQLKRLTNKRKWVSQRRLGRKLDVPVWPFVGNYHRWTLLVINMRKSQNTARNRRRKQIIYAKNLRACYIDRYVDWFWTMKNILLMMAPTCKETTTTTRMTNLNFQIVFALLEKRIIQTK